MVVGKREWGCRRMLIYYVGHPARGIETTLRGPYLESQNRSTTHFSFLSPKTLGGNFDAAPTFTETASVLVELEASRARSLGAMATLATNCQKSNRRASRVGEDVDARVDEDEFRGKVKGRGG